MSCIYEEINLSKLIQDFFCDYLMNQRNLSFQTIANYRDTFKLLFRYTEKVKKKLPQK